QLRCSRARSVDREHRLRDDWQEPECYAGADRAARWCADPDVRVVHHEQGRAPADLGERASGMAQGQRRDGERGRPQEDVEEDRRQALTNVSIRAIRCGTLFDGIAPMPIRDAMVVVAANRITAVGPVDRTPAPPGAEPIDLTNRFVMPGR